MYRSCLQAEPLLLFSSCLPNTREKRPLSARKLFCILKAITTLQSLLAGCKENHFYSLPFGQAEASIYQPRRHFNQPQKLFVLLLFKFLLKHHLPVGQVKNRIRQPDSKIHQPRAIGQYFLCTLTRVLFNNNDECFLLIFFLMTFVPKDKLSTSPRKEDKSVCFEVRRMVVSSTEHTYK